MDIIYIFLIKLKYIKKQWFARLKNYFEWILILTLPVPDQYSRQLSKRENKLDEFTCRDPPVQQIGLASGVSVRSNERKRIEKALDGSLPPDHKLSRTSIQYSREPPSS